MLRSGSGCDGRAKTIIRLNERINGEIIPLFWPFLHPRERERERGRAALSEALFTFLLPFLMAKIDGGAAMHGLHVRCTASAHIGRK